MKVTWAKMELFRLKFKPVSVLRIAVTILSISCILILTTLSGCSGAGCDRRPADGEKVQRIREDLDAVFSGEI